MAQSPGLVAGNYSSSFTSATPSLKILLGLALLLSSVGIGFAIFGTINKIFSEGGTATPFIVNYGLILLLIALVFVLFAGVSVQLRYIKKALSIFSLKS